MKNSNTLTILLAAIVMTSVLTGCGNLPGGTTQAPSEELLSEKTSSSDTIAPSEAEETTVPPTIDVNEALTNVWRIVENDCVDEIPIMPGLLLDDIKDWMKETEYKEARLARLEARKQKIQTAQALRKQRVESRNEKIKLLTEIRKSIRSLEDKEQKAEMIQTLKSIQKSFKEMNQAQRDAIRQELTQLRDKLLSLGA